MYQGIIVKKVMIYIYIYIYHNHFLDNYSLILIYIYIYIHIDHNGDDDDDDDDDDVLGSIVKVLRKNVPSVLYVLNHPLWPRIEHSRRSIF